MVRFDPEIVKHDMSQDFRQTFWHVHSKIFNCSLSFPNVSYSLASYVWLFPKIELHSHMELLHHFLKEVQDFPYNLPREWYSDDKFVRIGGHAVSLIPTVIYCQNYMKEF